MSRKSTKEYIALKRTDYQGASSDEKTKIINETIKTTRLSRKYVINLLNGKIVYRVRKGRGKVYKDEAKKALVQVWYEAGCPCAPYFKAGIDMWVSEYTQYVARLSEDVQKSIRKMSASSIERATHGLPRKLPGYTRANKNSGRGNNELKSAIPCHSGETVHACDVPPGDVQVDTFALGGGDPSDNFFWILDGTDRKTQWTVLSPTWNRGQHATLEALKRIERKFPFRITSLHSDNGGEIINHHVAAFLGANRKGLYLSRSRPRKCNDNAHVEEKNRSVGRALFGERRIDCPDLEADLIRLCEEWSDFCNFFRPSKMLVEKTKRADGKGYACRYDAPRTPYERLLSEKVLSTDEENALKAYRSKLHPIELRHRLEKRLQRIMRRQEAYSTAKKEHDKMFLERALPDSALRAAPSGSSVRDTLQVGGVSLKPKPISQRKKRLLGTQQLKNRKAPAYLSGTHSI